MNLPRWLRTIIDGLKAEAHALRETFHAFLNEPPATSMPFPTLRDDPPAPQLSCFVRGIIRSLETEPEQWERLSHDRSRHRKLGVILSAYHYWPKSTNAWPSCQAISNLSVEGVPSDSLSQQDLQHIARALDAHPVGGFKEARDEAMVREAKRRAAQAAFEKLGCPTPPAS